MGSMQIADTQQNIWLLLARLRNCTYAAKIGPGEVSLPPGRLIL